MFIDMMLMILAWTVIPVCVLLAVISAICLVVALFVDFNTEDTVEEQV